MTTHNFRGENLSPFVTFNTVRKDCIVCGSRKFSLWAKKDFYQTVKCKGCGFIWMRPFLTEKGLTAYYTSHVSNRLKKAKKMKQRAIQYKQDVGFLERYAQQGKLLDIGCSGGFFLDEFNKKFDKYGTDIDPDAVQYAKAHFSFGKNVHCTDILESTFRPKTFDVVTMRGVIEHVPDPVKVIKKVSQLLKKGGYYYVTATPNGASFTAEVFREQWALFHPVQHIWHFSPKTLSQVAERFGLRLVAVDFPYLGTPYEHVHEDVKAVAQGIKLVEQGKRKNLKVGPPFWENMMSLVFQKK